MSAANAIINTPNATDAWSDENSDVSATGSFCVKGVGMIRQFRRYCRFSARVFLAIIFGCLLAGQATRAIGEEVASAVPVKLIAMLTMDDQGKIYKFPS
ncbi:MAG: hypothetical protein OEL66_05010, partial [Desulfobulbaceae bacterium]|nr:hypothetical protein [Desulfobulbaceae bacterium]